jgi:hypothetical protein
MYPLPLVLRELYVAGRRPSTFRLRMAFGGGGMAVAIWSFLIWGAAHGDGWWIYGSLLLTAAVFAIVSALLIAGDSVSRERREGTLGFLFLTDLRPADVLLGKFAAAALVPGVTLLALFPGLALCQLLGGIQIAEFWRGIFALVLTLFFTLCATLFVSARCEDHRKAHAGAILLILVVNPLWLCAMSFSHNYLRAPFLFWLGASLFLALGVILLRSTAATLAAAWHDSAEKWTRQESAAAALPASREIQGDPVNWVLLRRRARDRRVAWVALAIPAVVSILLTPWMSLHAYWLVNLLLLLAAHLAWQAVILARTAYSFYMDRQDGSLELLLGTRLSVPEVFTGFRRFLFNQTKHVLILLTALDMIYAVAVWSVGAVGLTAFPLAMAANLWITVLGLGSTGVYRSLMSNHPAFAMLGAFARLSFFPLLISVLFLFVPQTNPVQVAIFWVMATGFTALFFGVDASDALKKHGRELLLRPFGEAPPHIENEWSFIDWSDLSDPRPVLASAEP